MPVQEPYGLKAAVLEDWALCQIWSWKISEKQKEEVSTRLIQEEFIHLTGEKKNKSSENPKL